jgi:hypothetical protein
LRFGGGRITQQNKANEVDMGHSVQLAHLVNGETISVRELSPRAERRSALAAGATVLALATAMALATAFGLLLAHRTLYVFEYLPLWGAVGLGVSVLAALRARTRARRYVVGVDIDDDAFAPVSLALVRRTSAGYRLALAGAGGGGEMTGVIETGRATLSVENLVRDHADALLLAPGTRAEISMAATTFVVQVRDGEGAPRALARGFARSFAGQAMIPLQLAVLISLIRAVPNGVPLGEVDMKSAIPADATPWEVEKLLRLEAQGQASTLHACFDTLPMSCQRSGYVGVGLSLSRQGEIRGGWIARSTYGRDCPVEACMSNVISTWFFEPLPESMRIVLPVQVLRTDKPLHLGYNPGPGTDTQKVMARNGVN